MLEQPKKTICYYSIATHLGGAERSLLDLMISLERSSQGRYRPWLLVPQPKGILVDQANAHGIEVTSLTFPKRAFRATRKDLRHSSLDILLDTPEMVGYIAKLVWILRAKKPVLIHTTGIKCHLLSAYLPSILRIPLLWHFRDIIPQQWLINFFNWRAKNSSRIRLIANSHATAEPFAKGSNSVTVVHNGLDPKAFPLQRHHEFHKLYSIPENLPLVGTVGVLARWKGQIEFIEMAYKLIKNGFPGHFVIIGDEIYDTTGEVGIKETLKNMVARWGLENQIHFAGYVKDSAKAISGLDVLVHSSIKPEPFGRVVLEAMALGTPVIAAGAGGILELIEDQQNGVLFTPGNSDDMAAKVKSVLADKELTTKIVAKSRELFEKQFLIEDHVKKIIQIYDEILNCDLALTGTP